MVNFGRAVFTGLLLCPALMFSGQDSRLIESFEDAASLDAVHARSAEVKRVRGDAADGSYVLEIDFEPGGAVELKPAGTDWRPFGALSVSVRNTSQQETGFSLEVSDAAGARTRGETKLKLLAGETARFALPLNTPGPLEMGMRGEPNLPGFRLLEADHKRVALDGVAVLRIALEKDSEGRKLAIDDVRLVPGVSYDKIIDRFGQYTREDWPGKVKSEADLAERRSAEEMQLRQHPALDDRDEYGGWASGPKLESTGFFRAAKHGGKWWLVTPSGHLFFSLGFNEIDYRPIGTVTEGRERMFTWLPQQGDPLAVHRKARTGSAPLGLKIKLFSGRGFNFYSANLERKYGKDWVERWHESTLARMRSWGFNTIGNWSNPTLHAARKVPYTALVGIRGEVAELSSGDDYWRRMYDTFDPRFAAIVERSIADATKQTRNDPWCIGYFVDNELPWGNMETARGRYGLALGALALGPGAPAKRGMVELLRERYKEIGELNRAWSTKFASWDELLSKPYTFAGEPPEGMRDDLGRFVTELATRYFRTIRDSLRRHDPKHMYLGNRFAWHTIEGVKAGAEFCDVMSFNIYAPRVDQERWSIFNEFDRPIICGEFHMGAVDRGMFHTGLVATRNQAERARMYQDYVRSVVDHPKMVGCHFFKYSDEPVTGRPGDGENYNIGFVAITDTIYPEMIDAARAVHSEVYKRRAQ